MSSYRTYLEARRAAGAAVAGDMPAEEFLSKIFSQRVEIVDFWKLAAIRVQTQDQARQVGRAEWGAW